jgi:pilus assembly protein FimV
MVRNKLVKAILIAGALQSGFASALGLGDLALNSALNQPFRAIIPLRDIGELSAEEIKISLADESAFTNAGVDRSYFLTALQFQVELLGNGNGRIIVTTHKAVLEPYLDFIVEARWPSGKMIREYTVLLDLPVFAAESVTRNVSVAQVKAPSRQSAPIKPAPAAPAVREAGGAIGPAQRSAPKARDLDEQQSLPAAESSSEYRVQHHDTMWQIAGKLRPSAYVTTQQTMLALLKKNPQAFVNGNVNQVKSGYVLRLPSEAEVKQIDQEQAVEEIRAQDRQWRGERVSKPIKKPTAKARPVTAAAASAPQLDATLKAEQDQEAAGEAAVKFSIGSAGIDDASGGETNILQQKLRREQELREKSTLESAEMQAKVLAMEKQIETLQTLISLKNSQLAAIQSGAFKPSAGKVDADIQKIESELAAPDSPESDLEPQVSTASPESGITDAAVSDAKSEAEEVSVSPPQVSTDSTEEKWYSSIFVKVVGLILAVLALLFLRKRNNAAGEETDMPAYEEAIPASGSVEAAIFSAHYDDEPNIDPAVGLNETESDGDVDIGSGGFDNLDADEESDQLVEAKSEGSPGDTTLLPKGSSNKVADVQPQTGDIVAEADIYVAYGRYDQAASLLKTAITQDPDNADLHVKLIDIYLDTRDRENFDLAFSNLRNLKNNDAIDQVKESMSAIEGVSDWLDDDALAAEQAGGAEMLTFDMGDEVDADTDNAAGQSEIEESAGSLDFASDDDLDFSFGVIDSDLETDTELSTDSGLEAKPESENTNLAAIHVIDRNSAENSADAEVLASLDVDLADLDFDFEMEEDDSETKLANLNSEPAAEIDTDDTGLDLEFDDLDIDSLALGDNELGGELSEDLGGNSLDSVSLLGGDEPDGLEFDLEDSEELGSFNLDEEDLETLEPLDSLINADIQSKSADVEDLDTDDIDLSDLDMDLSFDTISEQAVLADTADADFESADLDDPLDIEKSAEAPIESSGLAETELGGIAVEDLVFDEFDAGDEDLGDNFDSLVDSDSVATKLDLARAYVDMGDSDGAREMLEEVMQEGDTQQQLDAKALLDAMS